MARFLLNRRRLLLLYEENLEDVRQLRLERRQLRDYSNPFEAREEDFRHLFRVSRDIARYLCNELEPFLRRRRSSGLSVQTQVLVTLRFFAEGSYQRAVGQDYFLAVSQKSVSRSIIAVTTALCDHQQHWIHFPTTNAERNFLGQRFQQTIGFPGVIGAIDCTHIAIVTPITHEESYKNHKGFYSINVQMICDSDMKIMDVTAYPGTVHDQFIWTYSGARTAMQSIYQQRLGKFYLIGDAGYTLEQWLLTPLPHADEGTPEFRYTRAHCRARSVIERVFGVLKARWRCLLRDRVLHYKPEHACKIIISCAILHNIMAHHRMPMPEHIEVAEIQPPNVVEGNDAREMARRNLADIIRSYFA